MRQKDWGRLAAGLLLGAAVFALAGCGPSGAADSEKTESVLFELNPLEGYERVDGTFEIQDASGQTVAVIAADDALRDYPARSPEGEGSDTGLPVLWGNAPDGTQWTVTWSGPNAGSSQVRVLLSGDGGESWTLTPSDPKQVSQVYGAGFLNSQVGFVCSRYFLTSGPEIFWTRDGGASWSMLELPIPEEYQGCRMDAYSPQIRDGEVSFPVVVRGETDEEDRYVFCTSADLERWTWSAEAPDWVTGG